MMFQENTQSYALMMQESTRSGKGKAVMLLSLLLGVGFVALLSLSHTNTPAEDTINMATMPMASPLTKANPAKVWPSLRSKYQSMQQPSRTWQPSRDGQIMQSMQARQPAMPLSALKSPDAYPVANVEDQSDPMDRRGMLAAALGLAGVATMGQAANAAVFDNDESAFGKSTVPGDVSIATAKKAETLPKAQDLTSYNKVMYKEGAKSSNPAPVIDAPPAVPLVLAALSVAAAGLIPALLSPGQTALDAQLGAEKGQRASLEKDRRKLQQGGKKQWWGAGNVREPKQKR
jgi:hypothetical protein